MDFIDAFMQATKGQIFGGIIASSFVMGLMYYCKAVPKKVYEGLLWRFTCDLTIRNSDLIYDDALLWLGSLPYAAKCRNLETEMGHRTLGIGTHYFQHSPRWLRLRRSWDESKGGGVSWRARELLTFTKFGADQRPLLALLDEIEDFARKERGDTIEVKMWREDCWMRACTRRKRTLESVILPPALKDRIIHDLDQFVTQRGWYEALCVPYRRGILLEGPPGCGKTTLAVAIASHLERPLYVLNLGSLTSDDKLIQAISRVPDHAILLLEDIDTVDISNSREPTAVPAVGPGVVSLTRPLTLSALLNSIDGAFAKEGRILIMTTNHPEKLDPALLRPGRADLREFIGPLGEREVQAMARRFDVDFDYISPVPAAVLQEQLVRLNGSGRIRNVGSS